MSSDDMISIIKIGNKFFGYRIMLSIKYLGMEGIIEKGHYEFEAISLEDAILKVQSLDSEYGCSFYNLRGSEQETEAS